MEGRKSRIPVPEGAHTLIRNLERRKGLLERISKKEDIPEMVIKNTLLKFWYW